MTTTTDIGDSTSPPADQQAEEAREKRRNLMEKAVIRTKEMAERLDMVVRALKDEMPKLVKEHPLGEVIDTLIKIEDAAELVANASKAMNATLAFVREVSMPERMDADEMKTFNTDQGDRVTRTARLYASIAAAKQEEAYGWLRENDYGALIKETVNSSSLSAAAKELIENGMELPDEIFTVHMKDGISITRGKSRKKG